MNAEKKIEKKYVETPLMKQYYSIKAVHPDAILLFRVGDFYETFGEDAIKASGILGITLTRRANGSATYVELAGFPYHAIDTYLPKLVRAGERVAICEQLDIHRDFASESFKHSLLLYIQFLTCCLHKSDSFTCVSQNS